MTIRSVMLGGALVAGTVAGAWAHSGAEGVVKDRMDAMKAMQDAVKTITPMMSGQADYDAAAVREAADVIEARAGKELTELFPEGSIEGPSEALPAIWQDTERFRTLAARLKTAAEGLGLASENGQHGAGSMMGDQGGMMGGAQAADMPMADAMDAEALGQMPADGAFTMMTQVCSACHDRFREED
ncbi:c-type cytochrome [Salipiger mucosus]|uniref:Putative cytochrome C-like protein n=1 Tax=Salipiger mucosus DSM 16094 TaxID=1123237 RepID=S9S7E9_9RHOB|nr:cytochrome c [Salipiger mucosus]EPX82134.1 putative cytochrome C-like protein [Salipiger mucosus DSM 16094]